MSSANVVPHPPGNRAAQPDRIRHNQVHPTVANRTRRAMTEPAQPRITLDPAILAGKPVVRGTRIAVEFVIGLFADGWAEADILRAYPALGHEDIAACLEYACDLVRSERVYPSAA